MAMDDLSDDGVSPPEWQSGSEREPEDDKEIEGNEPDEIPPSDPDSYVGLKEAENNGQWLQCIGWVFGNTIIRHAGALPCYPVRFHTVGREASLFLGVIGRAHVMRCHRHLPWSAKAGACRAYSNGGLYA